MEKKEFHVDLKKLSADPRLLVVIIAIACIALIGLCVYTASQISENEAKAYELNETIKRNQDEVRSLERLRDQSAQYEAQNAQYEKLLNNSGINQEELAKFFDKIVAEHNCRDELIEFLEGEPSGDVQSISARIVLTGEMSDIMDLCDDIVKQDRFYRIDSFILSEESSETENKRAEITVVAFSK